MKRTFLLLTAFFGLAQWTSASDVELIVERVNNGGSVAGTTYRVWAHLDTPGKSLHLVWGDVANPLMISTTTSFYQHPFGNQSSAGMNEAIISMEPALAYDSFITVGYDRAYGNALWDIGIDFSAFNQGGSIQSTNGAWFLIPTDQKCVPAQNGLVLIAQFTTTGVASGIMNLQGWTAPQQAWRQTGVTFSTEDALVFGCTDSGAANYNSLASYDNGSCEGVAGTPDGVGEYTISASSGWDIFPNPVRESLLHVQFSNASLNTDRNSRIDIYDMSGKIVGSHVIPAGQMLPGGRLTLTQDLANGSYKVILSQEDRVDSKIIIVQR